MSVNSRYSDLLIQALGRLNPQALLADGLAEAVIGIRLNRSGHLVALYGFERCEALLVAQGMSEEDASEWMHFNVLGSYVGPDGPEFEFEFEDETDD